PCMRSDPCRHWRRRTFLRRQRRPRSTWWRRPGTGWLRQRRGSRRTWMSFSWVSSKRSVRVHRPQAAIVPADKRHPEIVTRWVWPWLHARPILFWPPARNNEGPAVPGPPRFCSADQPLTNLAPMAAHAFSEDIEKPVPLQAFWPLQAFAELLQALWPLQALPAMHLPWA